MDHPVKILRDTLGLKQADLATEIGVTPSRISQVENGHGRLGDDALLTFMERYRRTLAALGITAEDVIRGVRGEAA